ARRHRWPGVGARRAGRPSRASPCTQGRAMPSRLWRSWFADARRPSRMRIDKLLWFLRFARTRSIAQAMTAKGHIRLNGRRVERSHQKVTAGDVLTIPLGRRVLVIELVALPERRGPAPEAQSCYRVLDEPRDFPIAAANHNDAA